jgi:hypothetical protein
MALSDEQSTGHHRKTSHQKSDIFHPHKLLPAFINGSVALNLTDG